MTRLSYKSALRAKGVPPIRGQLRSVRADGHRELLPVRGCGTWRDGRFVPDGEIE